MSTRAQSSRARSTGLTRSEYDHYISEIAGKELSKRDYVSKLFEIFWAALWFYFKWLPEARDYKTAIEVSFTIFLEFFFVKNRNSDWIFCEKYKRT